MTNSSPNQPLNTESDQQLAVPESGLTEQETAVTDSVDSAEESQWWDDPAMPWNHKPGRADIACLAAMSIFGIFSLAMLPLKSWLLGLTPEWTLAITGSRTAAAATGASVRVGEALPYWVWLAVLGSLMSIKFDWIYWWAGKLWGRGMIRVWAGKSQRATRTYAKAEKWAEKLGWLGIFIAYVPIPLPLMPVVFVLTGATGMKLRTFAVLDFLASTVWIFGFVLFGHAIGAPAVQVLKVYAKFANYVAIGLVVLVLVMYFAKQSKPAKAKTDS